MSTIKTETLSTPSNSTVPVDTVVNGTAKAWVNFNGTGTVAIRRAFNVSSITDYGTGYYGISFITAMQDANYTAVATSGWHTNSWGLCTNGISTPFADNLYKLNTLNNSGSEVDNTYVSVAIFS